MKLIQLKGALTVTVAVLALFFVKNAVAEVSFESATNGATLVTTIDDEGNLVFVLGGVADGNSTELTFSTDSACPGVAMTGGAEFTAPWSCAEGVISVAVTYRGGMSFGPGTDENADTFYVTFSDPPAPPGLDAVPTALSGIQLSVFGDISRWDLSGNMTSSGTSFGVELTGPEGGEAHFRMYLPHAAAEYLGGVLGVSVGGKPDPFATVAVNEDGSVSIEVDITSLKGTSTSSFNALAGQVTKKIIAGERTLGIAFNKSTVKAGGSVALALCAGGNFTAGDKIPVKFTVGGKAAKLKKTLILDSAGCAESSIKLKAVSKGTLTAKVKYKKVNAKGTIKVTK